MAEGKIKYQEVADDDIYKYVRKSAEETLTTVNTLTLAIKATADSIKTGAGANGIVNKNDVDALTKALADVKRLTEELTALKVKQREANLLLSKSYDQLTQSEKEVIIEDAKLKLIKSENIQLSKQEAIETQKIGDAYKQLDNQYQIAQRNAKNLAISKGLDNAETKKAIELSNGYLDKLRSVDFALNQHSRNVGNYTHSYNGLSSSINQVTREFPAFINSAQTGFMAISNNLPILIDQIKIVKMEQAALAAEGKASVSVWKAVGGAFFSWQTALSLGITALTLLAPKLWTWITGTKEAAKETKDFTSILEANEKQIESLGTTLKNKIIDIRIANGELTKQEGESMKLDNTLLSEKKNYYEKYLNQEKDFRKALIELRGDNVGSDVMREQERKYRDQLLNPIGLQDWNKLAPGFKAYFDAQYAAYGEYLRAVALLDQNAEADKKQIKDKEKKNKKEEVKESQSQLKQELTDFKDINKATNDEIEKNNRIRNRIRTEQAQVAIDIEKQKQAIIDKQEKDAEEKKKNDLKKREQLEKDMFKTLDKLSDEYYKRRETQEDIKIENAKQRQQTLALLAQKGVDNAADSYAFEQKKQAEAEAEKLKIEKRKMQTEFLLALLKGYANNGGDLGKTLKDSTSLVAAAQALPSFYEGTEDTGTVSKPLDDKGGRLAKVHDNERIIPKKLNLGLKGMSNEEVVRNATLMTPQFVSTITKADGFSKLESKLDKVVNAIESIDIPQQQLYYNEYEKAFTHTTKTRDRILREHHKSTGLFS